MALQNKKLQIKIVVDLLMKKKIEKERVQKLRHRSGEEKCELQTICEELILKKKIPLGFLME